MRTEAEQPVRPASFPGVLDAGTHVHQLLHLAHALTHINSGTETAGTDTAGTDTAGPFGAVGAGSVGVDVAGLSDQQCLQWAQDLEQLLHYGQALAVQISGELGHRYAAGRFADSGARGQSGLLVQALHLSSEEAARRLKLATHILPVIDTITGAISESTHPHLAEAFFAGEISQERANTVSRYLGESDRLAGNGRISAEEHTMVEDTLVETAKQHGPDFIRHLAHRILGHLDPDGQKPSASDLTAKQGLFFRQPRRGLISFHGSLTIEQHEHLMAAIGHATNPNKHHNPTGIDDATTENGRTGDHAGSGDIAENQFSLLDDLSTLYTATATATDIGGKNCASTDGNGSTGYVEADQNSPAQPGQPAENHPNEPSRDSNHCNSKVGSNAKDDDAGSGNGSSGKENGDVPGDGDWGGHLPGTGQEASDEASWSPKTVNGIKIPTPGSAETLAGLDPIDPNSTDPAVRDTRTHGQKLLDGLISCLKLAARTNTLPINGGLKPQLILSCTQAELNNAYQNPSNDPGNTTWTGSSAHPGTGTIYTTYNGPMPMHLFDASLCDPEITRLVYAQGHTIINAGRTQRLFTPAQRKLLFARDLGCTFPDCTAPAPWTEAHHIIPWQAGGLTDLNNAALLCSYHHTLIHNSQWTATINQGTPHFTPPWYLDPTQTPRHNSYHHANTP